MKHDPPLFDGDELDISPKGKVKKSTTTGDPFDDLVKPPAKVQTPPEAYDPYYQQLESRNQHRHAAHLLMMCGQQLKLRSNQRELLHLLMK